MCSVLQEEELRKGGEPKYAHLAMELHVFIEVYAPIPEAYLRMAHAMEEVKKFLVPVSFRILGVAYFTRDTFVLEVFSFKMCRAAFVDWSLLSI